MRFFRGNENDRLEDGEDVTLAPTTAEMNEFLRQATRLREQMEECAQRMSTAIHVQDPPPRYSQILRSTEDNSRPAPPPAYRASQIPRPIQRQSDIQILSSDPPIQPDGSHMNENRAHLSLRSEGTQRPISQPAPVPTISNDGSSDVFRRTSNPLPLILSENEINAVITQLYHVFFDKHPNMPIQQARYYARSLRNAMANHLQNPPATLHPIPWLMRRRTRRSDGMNEALATGDADADATSISNGASDRQYMDRESVSPHMPPSSNTGAVNSPTPTNIPPRTSVTILPELLQAFSNRMSNPARTRLTPTHIDGGETPSNESLSSGDLSEVTLVNSSSDEEFPTIRVVLPLPYNDESDDETPVVEIHGSDEGDSDDDTHTTRA
jgi:hypothetical protein